MKTTEMLNKANVIVKEFKKGAFVKITYKSNPYQLKASQASYNVDKITTSVVRLGISYGNIKENKNKVIEPLAYGEYVKGFNNYIIQYDKGNNDIQYYLRVNTANTQATTTTKYYCNGVETSKQELIDKKIIGNRKPSDKPLVFNIKLENLISINDIQF